MTNKRVFISYSHDTDEHRTWVKGLAEFFAASGLDVLFDQWDLAYGDDLATFMETSITEADRVLLICTDNYIERSNEGRGGVGYEKTIATAEMILGREQRRKFIPVVRNVTVEPRIPTFLGAAYYADLSDGSDHEVVKQELLRSIMEIPPAKPRLGTPVIIPDQSPEEENVVEEETVELEDAKGDPLVIFRDRFAQAFPGTRGVDWFEEPDIIHERLSILLASPLKCIGPKMDTRLSIAWYWRGPSNLSIGRFRHIEGSHFLMGVDELNITKIAAVSFGVYYRSFVYVETAADAPTGLDPDVQDRIDHSVNRRGYADEEYGLVDGTLPVTRAEYDDGAAIINGRPVDVRGRTELRARYLTPYNFLIAPQLSPINNKEFDYELEALLNAILRGEAELGELNERIRQLPRRH